MNTQQIREFYQKNKVLAIGVPIIAALLLINNLVLKSKRTKQKGPAVQTSTQVTSPITKPQSDSLDAIQPPPPLVIPNVPSLDQRLEMRFIPKNVYPYARNRNIFLRPNTRIQNSEDSRNEMPIVENTNIAYHGFVTMENNERVAILKVGDEVIMARVASLIGETSFRLQEISIDKVVLVDTENDNVPFEIALADK